MFDSFKMMGTVASLMKNKHKIAEAVQRVQANLEDRKISVNAPDGSVQLTMNGKARIQSLIIAPAALVAASSDPAAKDKLEKTIAGAITAAQARAMDILKAEFEREATELGLPELASSGGLAQMLGS